MARLGHTFLKASSTTSRPTNRTASSLTGSGTEDDKIARYRAEKEKYRRDIERLMLEKAQLERQLSAGTLADSFKLSFSLFDENTSDDIPQLPEILDVSDLLLGGTASFIPVIIAFIIGFILARILW